MKKIDKVKKILAEHRDELRQEYKIKKWGFSALM